MSAPTPHRAQRDAYMRMAAASLITGAVLLVLHGVLVFVIDETNAEYLKASVVHGSQVPATAEGGSPVPIVFAALAWLTALVVGAGAIFRTGTFSGLRVATAARFAAVASAVLLLAFIALHVSFGASWPISL